MVNILKQQLATAGEQLATKDEQLATKDEQLAAKDVQIQEREATFKAQLAAKDEQIAALLAAAKDERKRPRSVTTNSNNTTNNNNTQNNYMDVNVFGKESLAHISDEKMQELIREPESSIVRLVTLKHRVPENQNVRIPNKRERWVERLVEEDGVKQWKPVDKNDILADIVENTAQELDEQRDPTTRAGQRFERWHDRLLTSANEYQDGNMVKGRQWKEQMDMVHRGIADMTRQ